MKDLVVHDAVDRDRNPLAFRTDALAARIDPAPIVDANHARIADYLQHQITSPKMLAIEEAALIEVASGRLCAGACKVLVKYFADELRLYRVGGKLVLLPRRSRDFIDAKAEGWLGPIEVALARILGHARASAHAVGFAFQLINQLEHALREAPIGVVTDLLLNRYYANSALTQRLFVDAGFGCIAHEARPVCHDDRTNLGAWPKDLLEHLTKLGPIVVGCRDASFDKLADEHEAVVLSIAAN